MKSKLILMLACICLTTAAFAQEKEQEEQYNQYGQKVTASPVEGTVQDGILVFKSKDAKYKFWFDIRVQGDAAVYFGYDKNLVKIGNGIMLRRTRFAVKAQIDKNWYGELDTDWTSGTPEIKDAILAFNGVKGLEIKLGNFKENFSVQRNSTSRYLQFLERPMVTYLAPSRHLGLNVRYTLPYLWASAGVFGPELKGSEEMTTMEDGNKTLGLSEGLSYTGKLLAKPLFMFKDASLQVGGAFSWRDPKLTNTDGYNTARYSARNSTAINRKKFLDTDAIAGVDHEIAWTVEAAGHWKGLRYEAAYISRSAYVRPDAPVQGVQTASGWYVQAGWLLCGGHQNYDSDGAKYTRITQGKNWGDLELCLRYETVDFNCSKYYMGGSAQAVAVGLNYYCTPNVKFMINYQYNMNDKYANGKGSDDGVDKGKYYTGYTAEGVKTNIPSQIVGKKGINYHMISARFQVAF